MAKNMKKETVTAETPKVEETVNEDNGLTETGEFTPEVEAKVKRKPREQALPGMESVGNLELERMAIQVDDIDGSIKSLRKTRAALTEKMLDEMKKANLTVYQHEGFLIEREEKGENIKIRSIKQTEDE